MLPSNVPSSMTLTKELLLSPQRSPTSPLRHSVWHQRQSDAPAGLENGPEPPTSESLARECHLLRQKGLCGRSKDLAMGDGVSTVVVLEDSG